MAKKFTGKIPRVPRKRRVSRVKISQARRKMRLPLIPKIGD